MLKKVHPVPAGFKIAKGFTHKGARQVFNPSLVARQAHKLFLAEVPEVLWLGPLESVRSHIDSGNRFFLKVDLASAFDSVTNSRLVSVLEGCTGWGVDIPSELFFHEGGGLIQGAPASQYLFRLYCEQSGLDDDLDRYCQEQNRLNKKGYVWSRYADDIILSAYNPIGRTVVPRLRRICALFR